MKNKTTYIAIFIYMFKFKYYPNEISHMVIEETNKIIFDESVKDFKEKHKDYMIEEIYRTYEGEE